LADNQYRLIYTYLMLALMAALCQNYYCARQRQTKRKLLL